MRYSAEKIRGGTRDKYAGHNGREMHVPRHAYFRSIRNERGNSQVPNPWRTRFS